jgi:hypothetical protein
MKPETKVKFIICYHDIKSVKTNHDWGVPGERTLRMNALHEHIHRRSKRHQLNLYGLFIQNLPNVKSKIMLIDRFLNVTGRTLF